MSEILTIFSVQNMQSTIWDTVAKMSNLAKILGQMVRISQKVIIVYIKSVLKSTICVAIVMHDKSMKEKFPKP